MFHTILLKTDQYWLQSNILYGIISKNIVRDIGQQEKRGDSMEYKKPYLLLVEAINEVIRTIDNTETEIIKEYLVMAQNIAEKALEKEKSKPPTL